MIPMATDSEVFLNTYAKVVDTFDPKTVARFCLSPAMIINDKIKKVMTSIEELEQITSRIFTTFNRVSIKNSIPTLQ